MAPAASLTWGLNFLVNKAASHVIGQDPEREQKSDLEVSDQQQNEPDFKLPTTVIPTYQNEFQQYIPPTPSIHDDNGYILPFIDSDIVEHFHNNSRMISDNPEYVGPSFTPLTAPELQLINVDSSPNITDRENILYLYTNTTDDLAWLIPAVFVGTFIIFIIIYASFYGIKSLQMKMMMCYFRIRGWCQSRDDSSQDETDALTSKMGQQSVEMTAYSTHEETVEYDRFRL